MNMKILLFSAVFISGTALFPAEAVRHEFQPDSSLGIAGKSVNAPEASEGSFLSLANGGKAAVIGIGKPGKYFVRIRYGADSGKNAGLILVIRDVAGGFVVHSEQVECVPDDAREADKKTQTSVTFREQEFSFTAGHGGEYEISAIPMRGNRDSVKLDLMIISDDMAMLKSDRGSVAKGSVICGTAQEMSSLLPENFFAMKNRLKGFMLEFRGGSNFRDTQAYNTMLGMDTGRWQSYRKPLSAKFRKYNPDGMAVSADGKKSSRYSLFYEPAFAEELSLTTEAVKKASVDPDISRWGVSEWSNQLDYGDCARSAFIAYLKRKYKDIAAANTAWNSKYASFDDIRFPLVYAENPGAYLENFYFQCDTYADQLAELVRTVNTNDPLKRPVLIPRMGSEVMEFGGWAQDFESIIVRGQKDSSAYASSLLCPDDEMEAQTDIELCFGDYRGKYMNNWFGIHAVDPKIIARTAFLQVAKGVKGISFESLGGLDYMHPFTQLREDGTQKKRIGAIADVSGTVRQFESFLTDASIQFPVKPVAIYYSRADLHLTKLMEPARIFEILRGRGYDVRWITPRQIADGKLKDVSCVILSGTRYLPDAVAAKLRDYVSGGGALIGDDWPGVYNEFGVKRRDFLTLFGVVPAETKAENPDEWSKSGDWIPALASQEEPRFAEIVRQWNSKHPVLKNLDEFMFSGSNRTQVKCVAGEVIGASFPNRPSVVVNGFGKGKTLYVSVMLGSLFGGYYAPYQRSTTHSDDSPARLIDAFLSYAGAEKLSEIKGVTARQSAKLRVFSPLKDSAGNSMIGIVSYNDSGLKNFELEFPWIDDASRNRGKWLYLAAGSRRLIPLEWKNGRLLIPYIESYGMVFHAVDAAPVVSVAMPENIVRNEASLAVVHPGTPLTVRFSVANYSTKELPAGKVTLSLPAGWVADRKESVTDGLAPGKSKEIEFKITPPALACGESLACLNFLWESSDGRRAVATEYISLSDAKTEEK